MSIPTLDLHETLLRLAGWVPDDVLAEARGRLAGGRLGEVARMVVFAGTRSVLPLTDDDLDLLADLLEADGADPQVLDAVQLTVPESPLPWRFAETPPDGDDDLDGAALVAALAGDDLVAAVADEPTARGLWRAWRTPVSGAPYPPARPVYVVEADDENGLPALAGRLQEKLSAAGETAPQVEVVPVRGDVPVYQRMAWVQGRLLWAAAQAREITVARVFDAVDPTAGPSFAPDHPRITDAAERERALTFLKAGTELLMTMGTLEDVVEPDRGAVVPMSFRTDGSWIWTDTVTYYLEEYQLAPDPELLRHIQRSDGPPSMLDTVSLHRAMDALTSPSRAEPVWSADGA